MNTQHSGMDKTQKEGPNVETTMTLNNDPTEKSPPSDMFLQSISNLEEEEKSYLNNRIAKFMGSQVFTIEDLPQTIQVLNKTYQYYENSFKETGYVDFTMTEKLTGVPEENIQKIFDKEVYGYFEEHFLSKRELDKIQEIVPEAEKRQEMFVDYLRGKPINLVEEQKQEEIGILKALFQKMLKAFMKIMEHKNELEVLFENIKTGKVQETHIHMDKMCQEKRFDYEKSKDFGHEFEF